MPGDEWTEEEDLLLSEKRQSGLTWREIAKLIRGRTKVACRARYRRQIASNTSHHVPNPIRRRRSAHTKVVTNKKRTRRRNKHDGMFEEEELSSIAAKSQCLTRTTNERETSTTTIRHTSGVHEQIKSNRNSKTMTTSNDRTFTPEDIRLVRHYRFK